jgi:hypothetical protein
MLTGRVDAPTTTNWINHAGRLLGEVRLWLESAATIGARYFGGHSPLFQDVEPFPEWERTCCEEMLSRFNDAAARTRGRKPKGEPWACVWSISGSQKCWDPPSPNWCASRASTPRRS